MPFVGSRGSLSGGDGEAHASHPLYDHRIFTAELADALRNLGHEIVVIADRPDQAPSGAAETSVDVVVIDLPQPA